MAFQHCFNRIHPLGAIRWMFSDGGPVKVVVDDFFWNNRGRINHHELGGIPLYWVKPVDKKDRKKGSWLWDMHITAMKSMQRDNRPMVTSITNQQNSFELFN